MTYKVTIEPLAVRKDKIKQLLDQNPPRLPFHEYQGKTQELPAINLDIGLPIYRMANFRTQTAHLRYLRKNPDKPATFFTAGQENEDAQRAQHTILVELAKRGTQEIQPIYDALKDETRQTDPLLITHTGVVVNGNRRLAAMRELYNDQPGPYKSFQTVQCIVLPTAATEPEIEKVEVSLQMKRETKLPYDWADQGLAIKKLLKDGVNKKEIAQLMSMEDEAEVEAALTRINEAEIYLKEYLKQPDAYEEIAKSEQVFKELEKSIRATKSAIDKEAKRAVAHVLIAHPKPLQDRAYEYRGAWGKQNKEVMTRLVERFEEDIPEATDDVLAVDFAEQDSTAQDFQRLKPLLSDAKKGDEIAAAVKEIVDDIVAEQEETRTTEAPLKLARKALKHLDQIEPTRVHTDHKPQLRSVLGDIITKANVLKKQL